MRKSFGYAFRPYYIVGDFNRDRIKDFAVIVRNDDRLSVLIFNGRPKTSFILALRRDFNTPITSFLSFTSEKRPRLAFGVFESDADSIIFTPTKPGTGYRVMPVM